MVFGAHLMRFRKLGLILVLTFMRFLCNFWVYIEGLMFEDGNLSVFVGKCTKFWPKKKNSSLEEPSRVQPGGEYEQCMMTSS